MINNKTTSLLFMMCAIILMATPYGVPMVFAPSPTQRVTKYFSYFSFMPMGYANWFPFIIGLLSIAIFLLILINRKKHIKIFLTICICFSLLSWIIFNSISIVSVIVTSLHIIVLLLQRWLLLNFKMEGWE